MQQIMYTGAVEAPQDNRHYGYDEYIQALGGPIEIDWERGFDIREVLGGDFEIKDQGKTLSCVGQAWSYQVWIYQVLEVMKEKGANFPDLQRYYPDLVEEVSAKAIYSQIHLPGGAAYIYAGAKLLTEWGSLFEPQVPFNKPDGSVSEEWAQEDSWQNKTLTKAAQALQGKHYRVIRAKTDMDLYAHAITQNMGLVGGVKGQNGRGWYTERPQPPVPGGSLWGHCIAYLAYGRDEYGNYLATPNSWGRKSWSERWRPGDKPGKGWQKLYIDYFANGLQFDPWTYTDIPNADINEHDMLNLIRNPNTGEIFVVFADKTKSHIDNMAQLEMGAVKGLWQRDWENVDEAELDKYPTTNQLAFLLT